MILSFLRLHFLPILIAALLVVAMPIRTGLAADEAPTTSEEIVFEYKLEIDGAPNDDVKELLEQSSRLEQLIDMPPTSMAALIRRADEDIEGFSKVMRSQGYYDSTITYETEEDQKPVLVKYMILPGALFRITKFDIRFDGADTKPKAPALSGIGVEVGAPARSDIVLGARRQLLNDLANTGFPDAKIADQNIVADFATDSMEVTLTVDAGPSLKMGRLSFEGLETVEERYMRRLAEWMAGVAYDASKIDTIRRRYLRTGLFSSVRLKPRETATDGETVPVVLIVVERAQRSIGIGASASTSEGFGTQLYWEHRNYFGEGEKVRADLVVAEIRRGLRLAFTKPNYRKIDQNLNADIDWKHENTEAYKEDSISTFVGLDRRWQERWVLGIGASLEYATIEDDGETKDFALAGLPLTARYDSTNDLLDPIRGIRFGTSIIPYAGLNDITPDFLRTEFDGSTYYSVLRKERLVLAGRGKIGMMFGDSTNDIPATKRFYSGGGGSIRGYKYQTVGPLDANNDPTGGRSLLEVGFEARTRITEDIGLVPFIEGGNVYESMVPDFSGEFLWGAGLGFRYYTAVGPIRLDVAVPLNRRPVDDAFQVYISIGQAF